MRKQIIVLLLAVLAAVPAAAAQEEQASPLEIGFGCCVFFNTNIGTPVFVAGEEIWLKTNSQLNAQLYAPNGTRVAKRTFESQTAGLLHSFSPTERLGEWRLEVNTAQATANYPIQLVAGHTTASISGLTFRLDGALFRMTGSLNVPDKHEGAVVLLRRLDEVTAIETEPLAYRLGELRARISWDPTDPFRLTVSPYVPSLTSPNSTRVWAEAWSELSFAKKTGANLLITLQPTLVARSHWFPLNLTFGPSEGFLLKLPELRSVAAGGQSPLREGKLSIRVMVEAQGTTYTSQAQVYLTNGGLIGSVANSMPVAPLLNPVRFELSDSLLNLSRYQFVFMAKQNGVNVLWEENVVPPIARFRLVNRLDGQPIADYQIRSRAFQEVTKVDGETFVIAEDFENQILFSLAIGDVALNSGEYSPNPVRLQRIFPTTVIANAGQLKLRLSDQLGSPATAGILRVTRVFGELAQPGFEREWSSQNGYLNLTLPTGEYLLEFRIEGTTIARRIMVDSPSRTIELQLNELMLTETRNALFLAAVAGAIALVEIFAAFRVWRVVARRRKQAEETRHTNLETPLKYSGISPLTQSMQNLTT